MNTFVSKIQHYQSPLSYAAILAVDSRGGIGMDNNLPWKLAGINNKSDMEWFKENTKGKIVIMGYNTWVSLGCKPLPGRVNIVVTENHVTEVVENIERFNYEFLNNPDNPTKNLPVIKVINSPENVIKFINESIGDIHHGGEVMIIGGAKIYESFMPWTSRIYLTTFDGEFEADTFVKMDFSKWDLTYRDARKLLDPKFEIWDCTEEAAKVPDSEFMQISHGYQAAPVWVAPHVKDKECS